MGKIFGISDLPASTIMTPFEPIEIPKPQYADRIDMPKDIINKHDVFVGKSSKSKAKKFIDMRNGFGKLMKAFSKPLTK